MEKIESEENERIIFSEIKKKWDDEDQSLNDDAEEIADGWLDAAIESKKAGRIENCIEAHTQRMRVYPYYKTTDAIRLLGLGANSAIEQVATSGLFEIDDRSNRRFVPSNHAKELGANVKGIFLSRGYTLHACQSFLLPHINDRDKGTSKRRIFSSQSFIQHRHQVFAARRKKCSDCSSEHSLLGELEILVWAFLFGLAIYRREAVQVLGSTDVDTLIEAKLLRKSPIDPDTMLVAEVQIYPIDMGVFLCEDDEPLRDSSKEEQTCSLFLTDWNLESLRPTHNAVMPVGYDTLELMAVTAGEMVRQRQVIENTLKEDGKIPLSQRLSTKNHILDLCCGCGIQGIFALLCYNARVTPLLEEKSCELILTDINERALHFAVANLAINGIASTGAVQTPGNRSRTVDCAFGLCGDLYESLTSQQQPFDLILCNPPFVAIPSTTDASLHQKTPLYGVGGGLDGMVCLQKILQKLYQFLCDQNPEAVALMVTEVPNVEESPTMLSSFLPDCHREEARVCIAYIEDDVETMEVYAKEREVETGIMPEYTVGDDHRKWLLSMTTSGLCNRALVLISFARTFRGERDHKRFGLFGFPGLPEYKISGDTMEEESAADPVDEEDMFLHEAGMNFARKVLLFADRRK